MKVMKRIRTILLLLVSIVTACAQQPLAQITPTPQNYEDHKGNFKLSDAKYVVADWNTISQQIIRTAFANSNLNLTFANSAKAKNSISLSLDSSLNNESYVLDVTTKGISIKAHDNAGLFYGIQTLLQLFDNKSLNGTISACSISDSPRFAYRGIMIDVSRHFRSIDFLKKQIDLLSQLKINRLHIHLTDAAGWRLEIKRYPRLTQYAAWRKGKTWNEWNENGNLYCDINDTEASGGFYTQDEMRDLIAYAADHCITIIPEIEMPSHSEEVTTAFPELSCTHLPKQSDFCVGNEATFAFIENVLDEVIDLFPSHYIHIGGDEASKQAWKSCELCQKRMNDEGLKDVDELQSYLIHRVEKYLNSKGRDLLGWDEILQGGLAPNATVMSWRGVDDGLEAAKTGHNAIMSPGEFCYFDGYQDAPNTQPEAIGGYLTLEKVYSYNPIPDSFTAEQAKYIIGVQGNLWCEYIPTAEHAEYMLYPRAIALAEVAWTNPENKSWDSFKQRVVNVESKMKQLGYNFFDYSKEVGNRPEFYTPINHLALGKKVKFNRPYWENYPANGDNTLTDGLRGGWNYSDKRWLAFVGNPRMDVVIDLEDKTEIHSIAADFMQICGPDVYMPASVTISVSDDGVNFTELKRIDHQVVKDNKVSFINFGWQGQTNARYVRYQADADKNIGGVLFVDEIVVK
jgi:hexosaminidase